VRRIFNKAERTKASTDWESFRCSHAIIVKRLLSLREKTGGNSAKTLRVLLKYLDLVKFSARITHPIWAFK